MPSHIRLPSESTQDSPPTRRRPRPAVGYRDLEDQGEDDSLHREVTNLNKDSHLASHVEGNRDRPGGLLKDANQWREGRAGV